MRSIPAKLTPNQRSYVNQLKSFGVGPDNSDFWLGWDEGGYNNEKVEERVVSDRKNQPAANRTAAIAEAELRDRKRREVELVLSTLHGFDTTSIRLCKYCNSEFATNYNYERYCSDLCRAGALRARGIVWNPDKSGDERWMGQPPSTISPATLAALKIWAHKLLADRHDDAVDNAIKEAVKELPDVGFIPFVAEKQSLPVLSEEVLVEPSKKQFDWMD